VHTTSKQTKRHNRKSNEKKVKAAAASDINVINCIGRGRGCTVQAGNKVVLVSQLIKNDAVLKQAEDILNGGLRFTS